jgi:hypothetical protein
MKYYSLKNLLTIKVRILLCALFVFLILGYGVETTKAALQLPDNGICCSQSSAVCVIGSTVTENNYYLKAAKCP